MLTVSPHLQVNTGYLAMNRWSVPLLSEKSGNLQPPCTLPPTATVTSYSGSLKLTSVSRAALRANKSAKHTQPKSAADAKQHIGIGTCLCRTSVVCCLLASPFSSCFVSIPPALFSFPRRLVPVRTGMLTSTGTAQCLPQSSLQLFQQLLRPQQAETGPAILNSLS